MMAAAACYNVQLVCFAVTEGGLSEYSYGGADGDCMQQRGKVAVSDGQTEGEAGGAAKPKLCLCLWRSHYWSTKPRQQALSSSSPVTCSTSLHHARPLPQGALVPSLKCLCFQDFCQLPETSALSLLLRACRLLSCVAACEAYRAGCAVVGR